MTSRKQERLEHMRTFLTNNLEGLLGHDQQTWYVSKGIVLHGIYGRADFHKLLDFHYSEKYWMWDNDQIYLHELTHATEEFIQKENSKGLAPNFIFLTANTSWTYVGRLDRKRIVNEPGGAKQQLRTKYRKVFFNERRLRNDEIVVRNLLQDKVRTRQGQNYAGAVLYFRAPRKENSGSLYVAMYQDNTMQEPGITACPQCQRGPEQFWNHKKTCKGTYKYRDYVIQRNEARHLKKIYIPFESEGPLQFTPYTHRNITLALPLQDRLQL